MCGLGAIAGEPRGLHTSPIVAKGHRSAILAAAAYSLATLLRYIVASLWHRTLCFSPRPTICWVLLFVSAVVPAGMCSVSRRFGVACGVLRRLAARRLQLVSCNASRFVASFCFSIACASTLGHAALDHAVVGTAVAVSWLQSVSRGFHALTLICHSQRFRCCS